MDAVVERVAPDIHVIRSVHPGGGANLFTGCYVLRAAATQARPLAVGAEVRVTGIAGIDTEELDCGISVGPSAADAAPAKSQPTT
ncbi:Phosphodiester glycosidase domain-containing protein OS=Streptomyces microflavus OX=1919 GN=Smic_04870 PE=4 SV=1 [Streptomyces microflavus]